MIHLETSGTGAIAVRRSGPVWMDLPLSLVLGSIFFLSVCLLNLVNITLGEVDDEVKLDLQVLAKLAGVAGLSLYGIWRLYGDRRLIPTLLRGPLLPFTGCCLLLFLSSATSISPMPSLVSSGSACVVLVATVALMLEAGPRHVLQLLLLACLMFVAGSWAMWAVYPEQGIFREPIPNGEFYERMGGLAHPNTLGQFCAIGIVLVACEFIRRGAKRPHLILLVCAAMLAGALLLCKSRTGLLAVPVGLVAVFRTNAMRRLGAAGMLVILAGILGVAGAWGAGLLGSGLDSRLSSQLAKSGDSDELTSLTGRSAIWGETLRLAGERPMTGYGMATSKELLREYSLYTHNMVLNVVLSGGWLAAGLFVAALFMGLVRLVQKPVPEADGLLVVLLVSGLTENVTFEFLASAATAALVVSLAWRNVAEAVAGPAAFQGGRP